MVTQIVKEKPTMINSTTQVQKLHKNSSRNDELELSPAGTEIDFHRNKEMSLVYREAYIGRSKQIKNLKSLSLTRKHRD